MKTLAIFVIILTTTVALNTELNSVDMDPVTAKYLANSMKSKEEVSERLSFVFEVVRHGARTAH